MLTRFRKGGFHLTGYIDEPLFLLADYLRPINS